MLGFPLWFFISCIAGALLFTVLAVIMVKKFFHDMPLGEIEAQDGAESGASGEVR